MENSNTTQRKTFWSGMWDGIIIDPFYLKRERERERGVDFAIRYLPWFAQRLFVSIFGAEPLRISARKTTQM